MEGLLLGIGFIGLAVALLTPKSKLGLFLTFASFATYFVLVGTTNWLPVILFTLGIGLIIFEVFIPDFGIAGILGFLLVGGGLYLTLGNFMEMIQDLTLAILLTALIIIALIKNGYSFNNLNRLVLSTNLSKERGYSSSKSMAEVLPVGTKGISQTVLRPSGKASFFLEETSNLDVISDSGFIQKDEPIEVKEITGSKIIVRRIR